MGLKLSLCECVLGGELSKHWCVCVLLTSAQRNRLKLNVLFKLCELICDLLFLDGIKRMYHKCLCLFAFAYLLSLICLYLYNNVFASRVALSRFRFSHFFVHYEFSKYHISLTLGKKT